MQISFKGKSAVVTGGANGIGLAMARRLYESGAQVYLLDLAKEAPAEVAARLDELASEERQARGRAKGLAVDVTNRSELDKALQQVVEETGRMDVAMINAGTAVFKPLGETSRAEWDRVIGLNLTAAFEGVQAAAAQMRRCGNGGAIVLTASSNSYDGEENLIAYNATKAGVLGLLHTAANELGPDGIRVNTINPGMIQTRLTQAFFDSPETCREYFRGVPLGRGGQPEEVAAAAAFLASDAASYITGASLLIDGGQMACKFGPWREREHEFTKDHWHAKKS